MNCDAARDMDFLANVDPSTDYEPCKQWCSARADCAGFALWEGGCAFKWDSCRSTLNDHGYIVTYLKETF